MVYYILRDNVIPNFSLLNPEVNSSIIPLHWRFVSISEHGLHTEGLPKTTFKSNYVVFIRCGFLIVEIGFVLWLGYSIDLRLESWLLTHLLRVAFGFCDHQIVKWIFLMLKELIWISFFLFTMDFYCIGKCALKPSSQILGMFEYVLQIFCAFF